jgi:uncharacterized protein
MLHREQAEPSRRSRSGRDRRIRISNEMIEVAEREGGVVFLVRVQPRASRDAVAGEVEGALKIRLTAPPVDDRANDALRRFLADRLKIPLSAVRIAAGEKSRIKRIEIQGIERDRVLALLNEQA